MNCLEGLLNATAIQVSKQKQYNNPSDVLTQVGCSDKLISYSIRWGPVMVAVAEMTILRIGLMLGEICPQVLGEICKYYLPVI